MSASRTLLRKTKADQTRRLALGPPPKKGTPYRRHRPHREGTLHTTKGRFYSEAE